MASEPLRLDFFCDTSSHKDRFMVAGGFAIQHQRYRAISNTIQDIKVQGGVKSEMKWSAFRAPRLKTYTALVDYFFLLYEQGHLHFHCLIADFHGFNHRWNEGDTRNTSISRMYYQLLLHRPCRFYGSKCDIYVYPDKGNDSAYLPRIRAGLNADAGLRYTKRLETIRTIRPLESSSDNLVQMVDVIVGAVAHRRNERHLDPSAGAHKPQLAQYVLQRSGRGDWLTNTPMSARKLTVWNFQHRDMSPVTLDGRSRQS